MSLTLLIDTVHLHMKGITTKFTTFLFVLLLAGWMQPATAQFGVAAGLNFDSADDIQLPTQDATLGNTRGYHVGVIMDFDLGPSHLRPGFFYRQVGTYTFAGDAFDDNQFELTAYEVPVDLRFDVLSTPNIRPYVLAGPMATFPQGEGEFGEATEDVTFSLNVGAGLSLGAETSTVRVQPEIRYEVLGTQFIRESFEIAGQQFEPEERPRFSSLSLRLNVVF